MRATSGGSGEESRQPRRCARPLSLEAARAAAPGAEVR
eukprot:CAMPEP_0168454606 /NCGR_PEP_ID=MMETSP0228-20121227/50305_1 /TAXON_ID=133427 /ORGANISM="Protoceratium reticulatum, Strain CCCM 535 (=CCMP 1889)" /LENGTH=37 /DNA_ID= /DNA_START= /DNA_END= /DNA_ORIENTATION=